MHLARPTSNTCIKGQIAFFMYGHMTTHCVQKYNSLNLTNVYVKSSSYIRLLILRTSQTHYVAVFGKTVFCLVPGKSRHCPEMPQYLGTNLENDQDKLYTMYFIDEMINIFRTFVPMLSFNMRHLE